MTCWFALVLTLAMSWPGAAWAQEAPTPEQQQAQAKLEHVRAQIKALAAQQRETGTRQSAVQANLAEQADVLAAAARAVRESEEKLEQGRARLLELRRQEHDTAAGLDAQRDALAALLRATYTLGRGRGLRLLLGHVSGCSAQDPGAGSKNAATKSSTTATCRHGERALDRISRALAYSRYFQRDRVARIHGLLADLARLDKLRKSIERQQQALQATLEKRNARATQLTAARDEKARLLAEVESTLNDQATRLQDLQRDQRALQDLLESLRSVLADIPQALAVAKPFARLRGQLPWPVHGRASEQKQGLLIQAAPGSTVHAVAHGRVAYADWLRGYGMLLIVDHGDGWMSLYGGNESLLHSVGEWVNAGDAIATSGRMEGSQDGLYFGLRHDGKSVPAQSWLAPQDTEAKRSGG